MQLNDDQAGRVRRHLGQIGDCLNRMIDSEDSHYLTTQLFRVSDFAELARYQIEGWVKMAEATPIFADIPDSDKGVSL